MSRQEAVTVAGKKWQCLNEVGEGTKTDREVKYSLTGGRVGFECSALGSGERRSTPDGILKQLANDFVSDFPNYFRHISFFYFQLISFQISLRSFGGKIQKCFSVCFADKSVFR